jgi:phage-related protein
LHITTGVKTQYCYADKLRKYVFKTNSQGKQQTPELTIEEFVGEIGKLPKQTDELFIAHTMKLYVDWMGHRSLRWDQQLN